jgi:hypothetical protein
MSFIIFVNSFMDISTLEDSSSKSLHTFMLVNLP